ncbi:TPA: hypothetical protein N0F65_010339 [Lagenidium giganteum]|uniref:Tubulin--tyrosine ligase-like protein 5 n=1 Tax=Lagenidium giganteum TaxID=4803 RepID=A0AAV2Z423_9STRA|nr:TPA: hypothetical protein N0F65_010339 [Lagenidium giganteum]
MRSLARVAAFVCALLAYAPEAHATTAPLSSRQRPTARFFLAEEPRTEHGLLLKQLERLGVQRYIPPNSQDKNRAAQDPFFLWSFVPKNSDQMDLVWSVVPSPPFGQIDFPQQFHAKVNHLPGAERLTRRDDFRDHAEQSASRLGRFHFNFAPKYFVLPRDDAKLRQAFQDVLKSVEFEMKRERDWYIYQRFLVREKVTSDQNEGAASPGEIINTEEELDEKLKGKFQGKEVEVIQYIEPLLLDNHKFNVGFYVVVTSLDPLRVYIHSNALVKVAKVPYSNKVGPSTDKNMYTLDEYLPPWDFPELQQFFREFPSKEREGTNAWGVIKEYFDLKGMDVQRLQKEVDDAIVKTVASNRAHFQEQIGKLKHSTVDGEVQNMQERFFELFKFDVEIDDNLKPWVVKIHSNPSLVPEKSVFGTDEAIKSGMLFDTLNLVGVHPQSKPPYESAMPSFKLDAKQCTIKCIDKERAWDMSCWQCPGWYSPGVARKLYDGVHEYARRGGYRLAYPDMMRDYSKYFDAGGLSIHDHAFQRYLRSFSVGYAQGTNDDENAFTCIYREHCSNHGDCVNGKCKCNPNYEGATCYIPKDLEREQELEREEQERQLNEQAHSPETWKERMGQLKNKILHPSLPQASMPKLSEVDRFSLSKLLFALTVLAAFLFVVYRAFLVYTQPSLDRKYN